MTTTSDLGAGASLIIATCDRPDMLEAVIRSVTEGQVLPDEIIVVDQSRSPSSSSGSAAAADGRVLAQSPCVLRHVHVGFRGLSRANNWGAALARHDVLLFTHDDVVVDHDWVDQLARAVQRVGTAGAVTGRVASTEPEVEGGFAPALRDELTPVTHRGRLAHDVLKPMNLGMHREVFEAVGGFDPRLGPGTKYPGAEDADLGHRLLDAGFAIEFAPQALVLHRAWRSADDLLPLRWRYGKAQGAFYAKHLGRRDGHMIRRFGSDLRRRLRRLPGRVRHDRRAACGDVLFVAGNLAGALSWWADRLRSRAPAQKQADR